MSRKITQEEFDRLYSDDITHKDYDNIICKVDKRFSFIMTTICPSVKKKGWFDYGNGNTVTDGYFDPEYYKKEIEMGGEGFDLPAPYGDACPVYIPTRWLWEDDFAEEFRLEVKKITLEKKRAKEKAKKKRDERKTEKVEMKKVISSKLTKEELKFIIFK